LRAQSLQVQAFCWTPFFNENFKFSILIFRPKGKMTFLPLSRRKAHFRPSLILEDLRYKVAFQGQGECWEVSTANFHLITPDYFVQTLEFVRFYCFLFTVQDIHPAYCLWIADLAEIDLSGLQILVPQDHFWDDFQRYSIAACICGWMSPEIVWWNINTELIAERFYHIPNRRIANIKYPVRRWRILSDNIIGQTCGNVFRHKSHFNVTAGLAESSASFRRYRILWG